MTIKRSVDFVIIFNRVLSDFVLSISTIHLSVFFLIFLYSSVCFLFLSLCSVSSFIPFLIHYSFVSLTFTLIFSLCVFLCEQFSTFVLVSHPPRPPFSLATNFIFNDNA